MGEEMTSQLIPPALAVGDALSKQFKKFASVVVEKGDMHDPAAFIQLIEGFKVVADSAGSRLLAHLLHWRVSSLSEAGRERNDGKMLRKRLWTEAMFLEATLQLVSAYPAVLTAQQAREMEHLAFDWILNADKYVAINQGDLGTIKERVILDAAKLLGALSPQKLSTIKDKFLKELGLRLRSDSNSAGRIELYNLCHGMRFVALSADTPAQFEASISFLETTHPLKHVAPDKKSRVQQSMCDMLSSILQPLIDEGNPGDFGAGCPLELRQRWFATIKVMRNDVLRWTLKQSKQVAAAYPLLVTLSCAESDSHCASAIDSFIEHLHKQLREKRNASMAIMCLTRCVHCYARRVRPYLKDQQSFSKWLSRVAMPVVQLMVRGGLLLSEQGELVRQMCFVVMQHHPEYAVSMILDLLQADGVSWEAPLTGVSALLSILVEVPRRYMGIAPALEIAATSQGLERCVAWQPNPEDIAQLEILARREVNPFDVYHVGGALRKVSATMSKLIQQCHAIYGFSRLTGSSKPYTEGPARERVGALSVFVTSLQCVPFILPDHWVNGKIFEDLSGYSIHPETTMRQVSIAALCRCLRTLPAWRDQLVGSFALFCLRLPDDNVEVIQDSVILLLGMIREWTEMAQEETPADALSSPQAFASLQRLEGCALGLLCASSVKTRRLALTLARQARTLHAALSHQHNVSVWRSDSTTTAWSEPGNASVKSKHPISSGSTLFVADVLEKFGSAIVARSYWDFGKWSDLWRSWRPVPSRVSFEDCLGSVRQTTDHIRWSRILCELMKEAWRRCPSSSRVANFEIYAKLLGLISLDSSGRQTMVESRLDTARAYCMVLSAAPYTDSDRAPDREFSTRDYVKLLLTTVRAGVESQQRIAVLALGNISQSAHRFVVQECSQLGEDYILDRHMPRSISVPVPGMSRAHKPKRDDIRLAHANILRLISENLQPNGLVEFSVLREKMVHFLSETARYIGSIGELSPELIQLRYCLCVVARHCASQLADALPKAFGADTRRTFFDMMSMFCEEGAPGHYRIELRRGVLLARSRIKDPEQARVLEGEITDASDVLEHAAYLGMAAVLKGAMFNKDVRDPKGRAFSWIDRMLSSRQSPQSTPGCWGPPKRYIAANALRNLLSSNVSLAQVFVDRCYSHDLRISSGYFKMLSEVFSNVGASIPLDTHIIVSLILHKIADDKEEIRTAAQSMLNVLLRKQARFEQDATEKLLDIQNPENLVIGGLSDSYRGFRIQLAEALAIAFPSIAEPLALEVLKRTREQMDSSSDSSAIICLCPWLRKVTISPQWKGRWADGFLSLLFEVTSRRSVHQFSPVEQLWATLAQDRRNVVPVLDFLLARCLDEDSTVTAKDNNRSPFVPAKQATLYISRVAPRQTIEHLVYEIQQQLTVGDEPEPKLQSTAENGQILEYQHARGSKPYQRLEIASSVDGAVSREPSRISESASPASSEGYLSRTATNEWQRPSGSDSGRNTERIGFSKSEIALVLLADIACEQDEEFRPHLHILLHVITISADSGNSAVRRECWQLLVFLLYTLSLKHLDSRTTQPEYHLRVSGMIGKLQNLGDKPMWPRERPTLSRPFIPSAAAVASFVKEVVDCFFLNADLREKWWGEALKWACTAHSRQLASRSHQVFCALRPTLSSLSCSAMMAALQKCMNNADSQKLDTAVEVLGTLRELLSNVEPTKFLLYPQIILAAISLLNSSVVRIGELAMVILLQALSNVDLGDTIVRNILIAMINVPTPEANEDEHGSEYDWEIGRELFREKVGSSGGHPWIAVQQLVIKGLFQEETELLSLKVLTALNLQLCKGFPEPGLVSSREGVYMSSDSLAYDLFKNHDGPEPTALESVLGHAKAGLAIGLAASLPFLCVFLRDPLKTDVLGAYIKASAEASDAVGWEDLREGLLALSNLLGIDLAYEDWLQPFCEIMCRQLFPEFAKLVLQRMLEVIQLGSASYQRAAVAVIKAIFESADASNRAAFKVDANWRISAALAPYIGTPIGEQVLDVYEAMVQTSGDEAQTDPREWSLDWPQSIDPLGDCNKTCSDSLQRIITTGANADGGSPLDVLPFIK